MFDDDLGDHSLALGTGYALYRHGQDEQTERILRAINDDDHLLTVHDEMDDRPVRRPAVNNLDFVAEIDMPDDWEDYIGQEPLKRQLMVALGSASIRKATLPHILLASGYPGVGKTMMARLIARTLGVKLIELVPPFNIYTLVEAAQQLADKDILFIDEIHKLSDTGQRGAEILLKVLEERVAFLPDGQVVQLNDITIIGATTDKDKLPTPVLDRFKVKPYFQAYSLPELGRIAIQFAYRHRSEDFVDNTLAIAIAKACRGTPRIIEEMVMACRDLSIVMKRNPTPAEMLEYLEVEPDGLTRTHIHYLTAMRQYFARETKDGEIEYIVGEAAIQQILRETKPGIQRVEGFLVERALIDRTPRGRRLTPLGIARAEEFINVGKGVSQVA